MYNGKKVPPPEALLRRVEISRTPAGGVSVRMADDPPAQQLERASEVVFTKEIQSGDAVIFPITREIPMR
jgi:hypothetical protein